MFTRIAKLLKRSEAATGSDDSDTSKSEEEQMTKGPYKKPRICLIDIDENVYKHLASKNFWCIEGSLGSQVVLEYKRTDIPKVCRLNHNFPPNLHEYDIAIVDLENSETIPYDQDEHNSYEISSTESKMLQCRYPVNIFNPRPISAGFLKMILQQSKEQRILIIFAGIPEDYNYYVTSTSVTRAVQCEAHRLYEILPSWVTNEGLYGEEIAIAPDINDDMRSLLIKHVNEAHYNAVFSQATKFQDGKEVPDERFTPLLLNAQHKIVAFADYRQKTWAFVFPAICDKANFIQYRPTDPGNGLLWPDFTLSFV